MTLWGRGVHVARRRCCQGQCFEQRPAEGLCRTDGTGGFLLHDGADGCGAAATGHGYVLGLGGLNANGVQGVGAGSDPGSVPAALLKLWQPDPVLFVEPGAAVNITCMADERMDGAGKVLWFRHSPGGSPRLLLNCIDRTKNGFSCDYRKHYAVLHIQAAHPKDTALYLCANTIVFKLKFGNGTVLLVGGRKEWGDPETPLGENPIMPTEWDPLSLPHLTQPPASSPPEAIPIPSHGLGPPHPSIGWTLHVSLPGWDIPHVTPRDETPMDPYLICPQRSPISCCSHSTSSPLKWSLVPLPVLVTPTSLPETDPPTPPGTMRGPN